MSRACKNWPEMVYFILPMFVKDGADLTCIDVLLADVLDHIPSSKYTLIYVTTPREYENDDLSSINYSSEDDLQEPIHQDLKRDFAESRQDGTTDNRSLFQKYQFLSPGIL